MQNYLNDLKCSFRSALLIAVLYLPALLNGQDLPPIPDCLREANCDPNTVVPVGGPDISGDCATSISRYLARAADVGGLTNLIDHNIISSDPNVETMDCADPYNHVAGTDYCPEAYCKMIKALVAMDIQMIERAFYGGSYHEHQYFPGDGYYEVGKQIVRDINYAYDCVGKPRPIIQGCVYDNVDAKNFAEAIKYPDINRHIPTWVIQKYFEEYPEDLDTRDPDAVYPDHLPRSYREYYFDADGNPKADLYFNRDRITVLGTDDAGEETYLVKIEKLEMRMWFLYQAWTQIDMGYTSLHMGLYSIYGNPESEDGSYEMLYKLTTEIREYADEKGTFVLLSGEPTNGFEAKLGGTHKYIFDFDSRAMRPREISSPQVSGDGNNCNQAIAQSIIDDINSSPCGSYDYNAVVDPCTINSSGGSGEGGISPTGCYLPQLPYTVHFDGFHVPVDPYHASDGPSGLTWGFHDHQWFSQLPDECKKWWFNYFYCDRRNYHEGSGFIVIPGIIFYDANLNESGEGAEQMISDNQSFVDMIADATLYPKTPQIVIESEDFYMGECTQNCNGFMAPPNKLWAIDQRCYKIKLENKDCSSIYFLDIKDPNGKVVSMSISDEYYFCPEITGDYEISIRQENLGLPAATGGTQTVTHYQQLFSTTCWRLVDDYQCWPHRTVPVCTQTNTDKRVYTFSVESDSPTEIILGVRPVGNRFQIKDVQQTSLQRVDGLVEIMDTSITSISLFVDVQRSGINQTSYSKADLPICNGGGALMRASKAPVNLEEKNFQVFPNPTSFDLNVQYFSEPDKKIKVLVYNVLGQVQYSKQYDAVSGINSWRIDTQQFQPGSYMVVLMDENVLAYKKFIKE